jgi:hypothetical protein
MRATMGPSMPAQTGSRPSEEAAEGVLAPTRTWAFVGTLTATFGLAQVWFLRSGRLIHDEGLLTWLFASYLSRDPIATLFFLKAKPALAALNLPGAAFGLTGFYVGHIIIGCAGVVAMAATARAAGIREWGIAAAIFASSPMYLVGTTAGFSNVDAAALTAVALWLIFRRKRPGFGTALVISLLPWIRFEAAIFVAMSGIAVLIRDRNPRFLVGLFALPVTYLLAGAGWHHDALWFWHFPATFSDIPQTGVFGGAEEEVRRTSIIDVAFAVTTMTPAIGVALIPVSGCPRWVPTGQLCVALFTLAIAVLPRLGAAMGYSQRYFLQILPLVAGLAVYRLERWPSVVGVLALAAITVGSVPFLLAPSAGTSGTFCLVALAATLAFLTLAWRRDIRLATIGLAVLAVAWPFSRQPLDVLQPRTHGVVTEAVEWLRAHPEERKSPVVVTNLKLLDAYVARAQVAPPVEVRCLIQTDNEYELTTLTDEANGQRARIFALAAWRFYGRGVLAREFAAHPGPPGALVVLRRDERLGALDGDALGAQGASILLRDESLSILRLP